MPATADLVREAWETTIRAEKGQGSKGSRSYTWASGYRECGREMALDLIHPEEQKEHDEDTLSRFDRGDSREEHVMALLARAGRRADPQFRVIEQQAIVEVRDRDGSLVIRGKKEGTLEVWVMGDDGERRRRLITVEVKSGQLVEHVRDLDGLLRGRYTKRYVAQLAAYLIGENREEGLFVLDRPGMPTFVPVNLLEDRILRLGEEFIQKARAARDAKEEYERYQRESPLNGDASLAGVMLPPHSNRVSECTACPHLNRSCFPQLDYGEGAISITEEEDPELYSSLVVEVEQSMAGKAYARAYKHAHDRLKGVPMALVTGSAGSFLWQGKWAKGTKLTEAGKALVDAAKERHSEPTDQGSFRGKVQRVETKLKED